MPKSFPIAIDPKSAQEWATRWHNLKPLKPPTINLLELFRLHYSAVEALFAKGYGLKPVYDALIADGHKLAGNEAQGMSSLGRLWAIVRREKQHDQQTPKTRKKSKKNSSAAIEEPTIAIARDSSDPDRGLASDLGGGRASGSDIFADSGIGDSADTNRGVPHIKAEGCSTLIDSLNASNAGNSAVKEAEEKGETLKPSREDRSNQRRAANNQGVPGLLISQDALSVSKR